MQDISENFEKGSRTRVYMRYMLMSQSESYRRSIL